MADDLQTSGETPGVDLSARVAELEAENADLKAKLAAYEPPPKPFQEYPKWVTKQTEDSIERVIVQDEAGFKALGEGWV